MEMRHLLEKKISLAILNKSKNKPILEDTWGGGDNVAYCQTLKLLDGHKYNSM